MTIVQPSAKISLLAAEFATGALTPSPLENSAATNDRATLRQRVTDDRAAMIRDYFFIGLGLAAIVLKTIASITSHCFSLVPAIAHRF